MKQKVTHEELAELLVAWIDVPENYSVIKFAAEHGLSKEKLISMSGEDSALSDAFDYAKTVQEYKVTELALKGEMDRQTALKMLETYNGWKSDVNILQKNEYKQYMNEAQRKAQKILGKAEESNRITNVKDED